MSYKTSKLISSKCLRSIYSPLYTLTLTVQITHELALIKLNLKNYLGNKTAARIMFNQDRFTHVRPLLKTVNALNVYQINLLQVPLFIHKIKTNSFYGIFQHQFQTINHKYTTRYSRNNFKEPMRETNYAKYWIHACGPVT